MKNCSCSLCLPSPRACLPPLSHPVTRAFLFQAEQRWSVRAPGKKRCTAAEHLQRTSLTYFSDVHLRTPLPPLPPPWSTRPMPVVMGSVLFPQALLRLVTLSAIGLPLAKSFRTVKYFAHELQFWQGIILVILPPLHISLPRALMRVLTSLLPCSRAPRTLARCDARLVCLLLVFCPPSDPGERLSSCPTIGSFLQNSWWKMFLMPNMHWMIHLYARGCWLHQGPATDFWGTTFLYGSNKNLLILFFF